MTPAQSCLAGGPVQLAFGVTDVHAAVAAWVERGAGPFFVREHIEVTDVVIGTEPGAFDHSSAFGQWGAIMVELIAVHDPPSLASTGLHHVAFFVPDFDAAADELTARGWPRAVSAVAGSNRFALHDARDELGHLVEIYEPTDALLGFYAMVADAAKVP